MGASEDVSQTHPDSHQISQEGRKAQSLPTAELVEEGASTPKKQMLALTSLGLVVVAAGRLGWKNHHPQVLTTNSLQTHLPPPAFTSLSWGPVKHAIALVLNPPHAF